MESKHSHGIVIFLGVVLVVIGVVYFFRPEANKPEEQFKTYVDKGLTEAMRAEFDVRINTLKASIETDEKPDITKYLELGNLYYQVGELGHARDAYDKILELNPKDIAARENLGVALNEMEDYRGAERVWAEALELSGSVMTVTRLVDVVNAHIPEDKPRLKDVLELAIQTFGQDSALLSRLGDWYFEAGEYERALSHYEVAKQVSGLVSFDEKIESARKALSGSSASGQNP